MSAVVVDNYKRLGILTRRNTDGIEFEMVKDFINFRRKIYKEKLDRSLAIFLEPKINNAYPDIILVEYDPSSYKIWDKARTQLELFDLKVLNHIYRHNKVSSSALITELSICYKDLLFSLERLYDSGLLDRADKKWIIDNRSFFGVKKIEAVEAKIGKWDDVFQQALVNKNFASKSFILTKRKSKPDDEIVSRFTEFGIGVYLFDDVKFIKISEAKKNEFPINYISLYINEWIGRMINC